MGRLRRQAKITHGPNPICLDAVAKETGKSRSQAMAAAVNQYLDYTEWFLASAQEGIRAADAGEFASPEKVAAVFAKWGVEVA